MGSKTAGTTTSIPTLSPEQNAQIAAQTGLFTSQIAPAYATAVSGATNLYNQEAPGVTNAAQNYAGTANQAQNVLGSTGQSALTSGVNALQNISSPAYQQAQLNAAMQPAEAQYAQNIAGLQAQFGGAGQIGSARQALAQQQTAGATQAAQETAAAQALQNITNQQIAAGGQLAGLGQAGLQGAQAAGANQLTAAMAPQQLYNQYAGVLFGTPSTAYNPNFAGTQATTTTQNAAGINLLPSLSDIRAKENIEYVGMHKGHKIYDYNYKNSKGRYRGVMAQDLQSYMPQAIQVRSDGMLMVDYAMLGFSMIQIGE